MRARATPLLLDLSHSLLAFNIFQHLMIDKDVSLLLLSRVGWRWPGLLDELTLSGDVADRGGGNLLMNLRLTHVEMCLLRYLNLQLYLLVGLRCAPVLGSVLVKSNLASRCRLLLDLLLLWCLLSGRWRRGELLGHGRHRRWHRRVGREHVHRGVGDEVMRGVSRPVLLVALGRLTDEGVADQGGVARRR